MRKKIFFGLITVIFPYLIFASELKVKSKISEVTVYPDNYALIKRSASLKLNSGDYKIIFFDLLPEIEENSLKVLAKGEAEFKIFGAKIEKEFLEEVPSEKIKQIKEEIQKLEDLIRELNDFKNLLAEKKEFLDSLRFFSKNELPKELTFRTFNIKELNELLNFLDIKLKENYLARRQSDFKIRELKNKLDVLKRELNQISTPQQKINRSIIVDLKVLRAGNLEIEVFYLVKGAFWQPFYEIRTFPDRAEIEINSYALVKQKTGDDWQEVELSLSSTRQTLNAVMPEPESWFIRPYHYQRQGKLDFFASQALLRSEGNIGSDQTSEQKIEPLEIKELPFGFLYKFPQKVEIKTDYAEHKLPIETKKLKAEFEYFTYPKVSLFSYLVAKATNQNTPFFAGEANIFFENTLIGKTFLNYLGSEEEIKFYLGIDENVKVKRELIQKKVDDVLIAGIPSPKKKITFHYKLTIENYKAKKIKLNLFEVFPVSEDEKITVKIFEVSLEPKEKEWQSKKGIWRWELELLPGEKKEIFYKFSIEHPRDLNVEGLLL